MQLKKRIKCKFQQGWFQQASDALLKHFPQSLGFLFADRCFHRAAEFWGWQGVITQAGAARAEQAPVNKSPYFEWNLSTFANINRYHSIVSWRFICLCKLSQFSLAGKGKLLSNFTYISTNKEQHHKNRISSSLYQDYGGWSPWNFNFPVSETKTASNACLP